MTDLLDHNDAKGRDSTRRVEAIHRNEPSHVTVVTNSPPAPDCQSFLPVRVSLNKFFFQKPLWPASCVAPRFPCSIVAKSSEFRAFVQILNEDSKSQVPRGQAETLKPCNRDDLSSACFNVAKVFRCGGVRT